jgi:tetratricopeptide (TPR) repeat protein
MGRFRAVSTSAVFVAATLVVRVIAAQQIPPSQVQLDRANELFSGGRYQDAIEAYRRILRIVPAGEGRAARSGIILSALRVADFRTARTESEALIRGAPHDAAALALYGDALWSSGLFDEAESQYQKALVVAPDEARAHHGLARALAARSRLSDALIAGQTALRLSTEDPEVYHTVGAIYERMNQYEDAADSLDEYARRLPDRDRSTKLWSRQQVTFLKSYGTRVPFAIDPEVERSTHTVDFRVDGEKIIVQARVNGGPLQDFVIDTGSEHTVLSRQTASRRRVRPIAYQRSTGIGDTGVRGLEVARIDSLEVGSLTIRHVPCVIRQPPPRGLPPTVTERLSPIALGFSMIIDYQARRLVFAKQLPPEEGELTLPLRMQRLPFIRGTVDGIHPASFVVDTGGEVISISRTMAASLGREPSRRIPVRVFGVAGWDRDAFLFPGVGLSFGAIRLPKYPVIVLNLKMPSALLGIQVGGIVGHRFLQRYRVAIDLERSELRLKAT